MEMIAALGMERARRQQQEQNMSEMGEKKDCVCMWIGSVINREEKLPEIRDVRSMVVDNRSVFSYGYQHLKLLTVTQSTACV